jgi:membrane associated rhomboid family serine protease
MFDWLALHWKDVLVGASGVIAGASLALKVIAPLTKNTADDRWAKRLEKLVAWLALNTK